ncbi:MAG: hypothetical protein OXF26_14685 [Alphaproteobacteria bacterium]|nr:hypothetical protein [Alphaproteobacteria bacterium]
MADPDGFDIRAAFDAAGGAPRSCCAYRPARGWHIREGQRVFGNRLQQRPTGWQWSYRRRQPVELDASAVFKSDVAMRARAYKALVDGGMTPAMAAAFAGLVEADNG